jgi:hypothetical protein
MNNKVNFIYIWLASDRGLRYELNLKNLEQHFEQDNDRFPSDISNLPYNFHPYYSVF